MAAETVDRFSYEQDLGPIGSDGWPEDVLAGPGWNSAP
jgi:hypothetical protein